MVRFDVYNTEHIPIIRFLVEHTINYPVYHIIDRQYLKK